MIKSEIKKYPFKWDLKSLYKDIDEWNEDFFIWEHNLKVSISYVDKLNDEEKFVEYINLLSHKNERLSKFFVYIRLLRDLDLSNTDIEKLYEEVSSTYMKYSEKLSLLSKQLHDLPEDKVRSWIKNNESISHMDLWYDSIVNSKPYILSTEEERILSLNNFGNHRDVYDVLTDSEMEFPLVLGEDDETEIEANTTNLRSSTTSHNREYRKRMFSACHDTYNKFNKTISNLYLGSVKETAFYTKVRNKKTSRWSCLFSNDIPESVYESLIKSSRESMPYMREYFKLKSETLGYRLSYYDKGAPIIENNTNKKYTFDEGVEIVLDSLKILGDDYVDNVRASIESGRIDVYPDKNKYTGAYSLAMESKNQYAYILLNWTGTLDDVFTLAHEIGHAMHSYYSSNNQIWPYKRYPIFTAEVASITNENILFSHLINSEYITNEEKITLIDSRIMDINSTFFRQVLFSEFEDWVHSKIDNNEGISSKDLNDYYLSLINEYYSEVMDIPNFTEVEWSRIPHFYRDYYVYQYATGFAASDKMNSILQESGDPSHILKFLKSGSSKLPIDTLRDSGVNMEDVDVINSVGFTVKELTDKLRTLLNDK